MKVERPSEPLEVTLGTSFFVLAIVGAIFTVGVALVVVWLISSGYPERIDRDGITTRGGARFEWDTLERTARLGNGGFQLQFPEGKVTVLPHFLGNAIEVLDYLQRCGVDTGVNMEIRRG